MPDYARHLAGWTGAGNMGNARGRGRTSSTTTRGRGRPAGATTQTTTRNRNRTGNAGGRVMNAAQDVPASAFSPLIARDLATVFGTVSHTLALSGIPLDIAQQILADGYAGK